MEDTYRRDFTMNAMYYNIIENIIEDPSQQGISDLKSKLLRMLGW